ncbi:hypothetical protein SKAU_G00017340 [Synaphobranchus kaupii]|uniref:BZIP domain-containing protein n=1 Tax=Synaphobranchus kaupii TaxID=118154 RepID=A0A9Q1GB38_SYNKA|nr:hypothetical protein SKAU_G00017340 [Synaphobranchus kaupii]
MQSVKKEPPSDSFCNGAGILGLAGALQGPDMEEIGQKLSNAASNGKNSSCRRKREFIPDENKDELYWERRRKNNEAAKRSREKRRINDMVLENKMMALGEENASLKAELLSLKLRFGLVSSSMYAHEVQKIPGASAVLYQDLVSTRSKHVSLFGESNRACTGSSCISVIKHGTQSDLSEKIPVIQGNTRRTSEVIKQELMETGCYPRELREGSSLCELYPNYIANSFSGNSSQLSPLLPITRSSSNSPRALDGDEGAASKSSDREDEQRVPKGPIPSPMDPKSVITSTAKVPETSSSALPHKLRIKAKPVQIKVEAMDSDYVTQGKSFPHVDMSMKGCNQAAQRIDSPLSLQVADLQDWTHQPAHWHAGRPETLPSGYKKRLCPSPGGHLTDKRIVDLKESSLTDSDNLYLKQGIVELSAEVASLKRLQQVSVVELGQSTAEHALLSKSCYAK